MSQVDVEIVRRGFEAFGRGEVEASLADFAEDAEWYAYLGSVDSEVHRGREAIERMVRDFGVTFDGFEVVADEIIDAGEGLVVVALRARGTGRGSGADVEQEWAQLWSLREGKIIRVKWFVDADAALAAAKAEA